MIQTRPVKFSGGFFPPSRQPEVVVVAKGSDGRDVYVKVPYSKFNNGNPPNKFDKLLAILKAIAERLGLSNNNPFQMS